jgi:hypothetical protein
MLGAHTTQRGWILGTVHTFAMSMTKKNTVQKKTNLFLYFICVMYNSTCFLLNSHFLKLCHCKSDESELRELLWLAPPIRTSQVILGWLILGSQGGIYLGGMDCNLYDHMVQMCIHEAYLKWDKKFLGLTIL